MQLTNQEWDVCLPPIQVEEIHVRSAQNQIRDYWHDLSETQRAHPTTQGEGVVVFVIDTTFKTDHPDLRDNLLLEYAASFIDGPGEEDTNGHGIHCLGIVGALDNQIGVLGAAPRVKMVPVRALNNAGSGTWQSVANAIRYAADVNLGAYNGWKRIISLSLGGPTGSTILKSALEHAKAKGCFTFAAAGNSGFNPDRDTMNYPAAYEDLVIAVGSVARDEKPSWFSSAGDALDVVSFGESILSTYRSNTYARLSGTSMATPIAAGLAALILNIHKDVDFTLDSLKGFIKKHAKDIYTPGEDKKTGAGLMVMGNYIDNKPGEGQPPVEEPPVQPPKKERELRFFVPGPFNIIWGTTIRPNTASISCVEQDDLASLNNKTLAVSEFEITMKTAAYADKAYDGLHAAVSQFFVNRGLILSPEDDFNDALKWTVHFLQMLAPRFGTEPFVVESVKGADGKRVAIFKKQ
jgi:subtilisin family serine protease